MMPALLIAALLVFAIPVGLLVDLLLPLRSFRIRRLFPYPPRGANWRAGKVGGIPFLVENGLPYPCAVSSSGRRRTSLDGEWFHRFESDDRPALEVIGGWSSLEWKTVSVPSVFNAASGGRTDYLGAVWYRKDFVFRDFPAPGGTVRLCLHGVLLRGRVWLNGIFLGSIEGGYTPRYFDVTSAIGTENILFVMTDNRLTADSLPMRTREDHNPGWHAYGGIYRSVELETLPARFIVKGSVSASPSSDGRVFLEAEALTCGAPEGDPEGSSLSAELRRGDGTVHRLSMELVGREGLNGSANHPSRRLEAWRGGLEVDAVDLWSPEDPLPYELSLSLRDGSGGGDRIALETGFRTFAVEGERFLLNGEPVFLKGICKHEDHPELGPVQTKELVEQDLGLIAELGANYIRLAHYPHDEKELARARDMGFMLSEEIPLYQAGVGFTAWFQEGRPLREFPRALFGLRQLASAALIDNARRHLAEMIERDRNNPAILFWSVGNECYTLGKRAGKIFSALRDTAKFFDPDRPVTNVELTYHVPSLDAAKRGWTGMDFLCLNSYFGWYYGALDELPGYLERSRKRWRGKPLILSEFGGGAAKGRHDRDGDWEGDRVEERKTYSEEYQESLIRGYCDEAAKHPWIRGLSPWVFCDFYNTWFPHNPVPNYNLKGLVSSRREPKAAFYALKEIYRDL